MLTLGMCEPLIVQNSPSAQVMAYAPSQPRLASSIMSSTLATETIRSLGGHALDDCTTFEMPNSELSIFEWRMDQSRWLNPNWDWVFYGLLGVWCCALLTLCWPLRKDSSQKKAPDHDPSYALYSILTQSYAQHLEPHETLKQWGQYFNGHWPLLPQETFTQRLSRLKVFDDRSWTEFAQHWTRLYEQFFYGGHLPSNDELIWLCELGLLTLPKDIKFRQGAVH